MQEWTTRGHAISRTVFSMSGDSLKRGRSSGPGASSKRPAGPVNRDNNCKSLRVSTSLREALLLLGRLLADRIGCEVDPIGNECICRLDLQQTADSFLRRCVSDNCGSHAFDVSSAVSIYAEYCTSNGYTRGDVHHADDRDDFIRYADRLCGRNGECHARCWRLGDDVCGRRSLD
ncbi:hypothetical protein BA78_8829 [Aspergillus fumigatus]|nr:hypothetical protein BA78_8829 [Aspergillus fumigatus]